MASWCCRVASPGRDVNYDTFGIGGGCDIGWVVMVVGMVRYCWCYWSSDGCGGDDGCRNGGSCE